MGSLSDYAEVALLQHVFNTAYTSVATIYVALCTADPTDAATGAAMSEVANTGAYQRTAITFGAAAARKVIQSGAVTFPQASGSWGTVTHWTIVDTQTYGSGNVLAHGAFTSSFGPVAGNTPTIPSGEIQVQMTPSQYTATTLSQAAADTSVNDSANALPLWPAGTVIFISGFTGGGFNGQATVVTSTVSKITFSGPTFVNDAAGESVTLALSGGFTDYTVHNLFNRMFRNQVFAKPSTYVGLSTKVTPILDTDVAAGSISEVSGGAYARVQVNPNGGASPTWTNASGGALDNVQAITFPTPSGSWGLVTSMFIADSVSGAGNVLAFDSYSIVDQTPVANDTVQFAIGSLDIALS